VTTVSVVMATYNRRALLERVLPPLLDDPATFELVVVVDGCEDGSLEYLEALAAEDPRVRPIFTANGGRVAAQELGVEAARGDVVLVMDDDVVAAPGLVSGHARHHERERDLVVVGYMPTERPRVRGPGSFTSELYHDVYEYRCQGWESGSEAVLRGLWSGNLSLRRETLLAVGSIGGGQPLNYHHDWELGLRLMRVGLTGRFDRSLAAQHLHERSAAAFARESRVQGRDMWLIEHLHGSVLGADQIRDRYYDRTRALTTLLAWSDRPRAYALIRAALDAALFAAGRLGAYDLERKVASVLGHVERRRGEYEQSRETPHVAPWQPPQLVL
jgi:glycosyltransferase involved in cell wall biosynthesis